MSDSTIASMPNRPTLLRQSPMTMTLREAIAGQIRGECKAHGWSCLVLAEILHVSVHRARDLYAGRRRGATIDELELLCKAANMTIVEFVEQATDRRAKRRVFEDTTVTELALMAAEQGTTPGRLLEQQGWMKLPAHVVPAYLGGAA